MLVGCAIPGLLNIAYISKILLWKLETEITKDYFIHVCLGYLEGEGHDPFDMRVCVCVCTH